MTPDPNEIARVMMVRINDLKRWFEIYERIHFVFGLPEQYEKLEDCLKGEICE